MLHTPVGGAARVTLQAATEGGDVVMTAIGSDPDTGEAGLAWTTMRQALFVQLGVAAMSALGWEQVSAGPDWWQVRYRGGPSAKIATIEPGGPTEEPSTAGPPTGPSAQRTVQPSAPAVPSRAGSGVADLLALMGRSIEDPLVHGMFMTCRIPQSTGDIDCASAGFRLTLGSSMTVIGITRLGEPEQRTGGLANNVALQYSTDDGNVVVIELSAFHDRPEDLAGSTIMRIHISRC